MNFKFLTGDINWADYGGVWVSKQLHNGDWPYYLVMELTNMDDVAGVTDPLYHITLSAVSPEAAGEARVLEAISSFGWDQDSQLDINELMTVEALHEYGVKAPLYSNSGNNYQALMKDARQEADTIEALFGFYMDRPVNRLGSTGWDFIAGDIMAGLHRQGE